MVQYVIAAGIAMFLANASFGLVNVAAVGAMSDAGYSMALYFTLLPFIYAVPAAFVWIVVYLLFAGINVRKAMRWVWWLGILGALGAGARYRTTFEDGGHSLPEHILLFFFFGGVLTVFTFRLWYRGQASRWQ